MAAACSEDGAGSADAVKMAESAESKNIVSQQEQLRRFLNDPYIENCLSFVIFANLLICLVEVDMGVNDAQPSWLPAINYAFSAVYTCEILLRMYAVGYSFWTNAWSVTDAFIVFIDDTVIIVGFLVSEALPSVSMMRLVRLLRLSRSRALFKLLPDIHVQIECLLGALKPMCVGLILIIFTMVMFSAVGVMFIHPINQKLAASGIYEDCARCPHAFESVAKTALTLAQNLLLGDSWGKLSIPIIESQPFSAIYFMFAYVVICLVLVNIILGAVVQSAQQARISNDSFVSREKELMKKEGEKMLLKICAQLDVDHSGYLTKDELLNGLHTSEDFAAALHCLDIEAKDLETVWDIIDIDNSGTVDYTEFVEQVYKMKTEDAHTMLLFIRFYIAEIHLKMQNEDCRAKHEPICRVQDVLDIENPINMLDNAHSRPDKIAEAIDIGFDKRAFDKQSVSTKRAANLKEPPPLDDVHTLLVTNPDSDIAYRVQSILGAPPLDDVQTLLNMYWEKQQRLFCELTSALTTAVPRVLERRSSEVESLPQNLSPQIGRRLPEKQSAQSNHPLREICSGPPEPVPPVWYAGSWPEKDEGKADV